MTWNLPQNVTVRGGRIYIKLRLPNVTKDDGTVVRGKWRRKRTGLEVSDANIKAAEKLRQKLQAALDDGKPLPGPVTVKDYAEAWLAKRKGRVGSYRDDRGRIRNHVLPGIGKLEMADVRPHHVRDLMRALEPKIPVVRTFRHVFNTMSTMFAEAVIDEVIATNPCTPLRETLPVIVDKDPEWRMGAKFGRSEVTTLTSDTRIALHRLVTNSLLFFGGPRFGEVAALRWRVWDQAYEPLTCLHVVRAFSIHDRREKDSKTKAKRKVPVHPVLQAILTEWWSKGWEQHYGRKPRPSDLIVPHPENPELNADVKAAKKLWDADLDALELRKRRQHDTRRTFIGIALDGGAHRDRLGWVTHGRPGDTIGDYDEPAWDELCAAVLCFRIEHPSVVQMVQRVEWPTQAESTPPGDPLAQRRDFSFPEINKGPRP